MSKQSELDRWCVAFLDGDMSAGQFKRAINDWHNKRELEARIEEVEMFSAGVAPGKYMAPHWYAEDRIKELSQTLKELKENL